MDEINQMDDKLKIKRELTNARVKKCRKKKCTESQQLNSSMQDDPTEEIRKTSKLKKIMSDEREQRKRNVREGFVRRNVLMS